MASQKMKSIEDLRKWLQPTEYLSPGNEYMKHLNSYVPGTGDWLRDSEVFRNWEDGTETGCLWLRGLPGSGKSVFSASTVKMLAETQDSEGSKSPVLFFFFRQIVEKNHDPKYLIRDWAAQLLPFSVDLQEKIDGISRGGGVNYCERTKLWDALVGAMEGLPKVYCVADALDEMDDQHIMFVERLKQLGCHRPENIKVMLTSRPIPKIEILLRDSSVESVKLEPAQIYPDIVSFVTNRLESVSPRLSQDKETQVSKAICDRSGGLFLYARLTVDSLIQGLVEGSIIEDTLPTSLAQLPQNLAELYTRLLEEHSRRSDVTLEQQFTILQCVIFSSRPMRLIELGSIMALLMKDSRMGLKEGKDSVRQACGRLLEILEDESVSVIHHSLTEFVIDQSRSTNSKAFPVSDEMQAQRLMLQVCLQYLDSCQLPTSTKPSVQARSPLQQSGMTGNTTDEGGGSEASDFEDDSFDTRNRRSRDDEKKDQDIQRLRSAYPFMAYATDNLVYHMRAAEAAGDNFSLLDSYFIPGKKAFAIWLLVKWHQDRRSKVMPLHVAAYNGFAAYARHLITRRRRRNVVDIQDDDGRTALSYAAEKGHVEIASLLLSNGANPDMDDNIGYKPLHHATQENQPKIVRLLLAAGVSPKTPKTRCSPELEMDMLGTDIGDTPLLYACRRGYTEILNQFLGYLNEEDACRCLHWTVRSRKLDAVAAILGTGKAAIDALIEGVSVLIIAAELVQPALIKLLLKHGANPNLRAEKESWYGLYEMDSEIKFKGDSETGPTALHVLAGYRHKACLNGERAKASECLQLLIDAGCDVNARTVGNHAPLHYAVQWRFTMYDEERGDEKSEEIMTELLLQHGADPTIRCHSGATPLHKLNPKRPKVVDILVENGADVNARDNASFTPLLSILASSYDAPGNEKLKEETLLKLLGHGADVTAESDSWWTAYHLMFDRIEQYQSVTLWKAFINAGADLNKPNTKGKLPLQCLKGDRGQTKNESLLKMLVDEGLQLNTTDILDSTALFDLFHRHDVSVESFEQLLKMGCSIKARDEDGATLLHHCIKSDKPIEIFQFLVNAGANPLAVDKEGNNLFHQLALAHPSCFGFPSKIQVLVNLGVATNTENKARETALHLACQTECENNGSDNKRGESFLDYLLNGKLYPALNPDAVDIHGASPIHYAASFSEFYVGRLLKAGADPTLKTKVCFTPLHIAARGRQSNVIGCLLSEYRERGILELAIDAIDDSGRTALYYACLSGHPESVKYLLSSKASFMIRDKAGRTPLHALADCEAEELIWTGKEVAKLPESLDAAWAALGNLGRPRPYHGSSIPSDAGRVKDIIEMLEQAGADLRVTCPVDGVEYTLMDLAVQAKAKELVNELRDRGFSAQDRTAENLIPKPGGMKEAKALFGRVDPPRRGNYQSPTDRHTTKKDHVNKFEEILQKKDYNHFREFVKIGGDLTAFGGFRERTALHMLVEWGHVELLESYSEEAAKIDDEEWMKIEMNPGSLLCHACEQSLPRLDIIKVLVEKVKVDVNLISNRYGYIYKGSNATALHWLSAGVHFWNIEAIEYLLDHGADIEARNGKGETPLMTALGSEYPNGFWKEETTRVLLERGANPNAICDSGNSCLNLADHANVTRMLLDHGADITVGKVPPFTSALSAMNVDAARMLLQAGVDPDKYHSLHQAARPLEKETDDVLWVQHQRDMISLLLEHKADPYAFFEDGFSVLQKIIEEHGILDLFCNLPNFPIELKGKGGRTLLISACFPSITPCPPDYNYYGNNKPKPKLVCFPTAAFHLLKMGADVLATDDLGRTALHWLCTLRYKLDSTHQTLFKELISHSPQIIHQKDNAGFTPLQTAISNPQHTHIWITNHLLTLGCSPLTPDPHGNTILHYLAPQLVGEKTSALAAAEHFNSFLAMDLPINHRNTRGETALAVFISTSYTATHGPSGTSHPSWAIANDISHLNALPLFLTAGADIHTVDAKGRNLLHLTAKRWRGRRVEEDQREDMLGIFKELMSRGVDVRGEDEGCRTAIDVAVAGGNGFLVDLFGVKERGVVGREVREVDTESEKDEEESDDDVDNPEKWFPDAR